MYLLILLLLLLGHSGVTERLRALRQDPSPCARELRIFGYNRLVPYSTNSISLICCGQQSTTCCGFVVQQIHKASSTIVAISDDIVLRQSGLIHLWFTFKPSKQMTKEFSLT